MLCDYTTLWTTNSCSSSECTLYGDASHQNQCICLQTRNSSDGRNVLSAYRAKPGYCCCLLLLHHAKKNRQGVQRGTMNHALGWGGKGCAIAAGVSSLGSLLHRESTSCSVDQLCIWLIWNDFMLLNTVLPWCCSFSKHLTFPIVQLYTWPMFQWFHAAEHSCAVVLQLQQAPDLPPPCVHAGWPPPGSL